MAQRQDRLCYFPSAGAAATFQTAADALTGVTAVTVAGTAGQGTLVVCTSIDGTEDLSSLILTGNGIMVSKVQTNQVGVA